MTSTWAFPHTPLSPSPAHPSLRPRVSVPSSNVITAPTPSSGSSSAPSLTPRLVTVEKRGKESSDEEGGSGTEATSPTTMTQQQESGYAQVRTKRQKLKEKKLLGNDSASISREGELRTVRAVECGNEGLRAARQRGVAMGLWQWANDPSGVDSGSLDWATVWIGPVGWDQRGPSTIHALRDSVHAHPPPLLHPSSCGIVSCVMSVACCAGCDRV